MSKAPHHVLCDAYRWLNGESLLGCRGRSCRPPATRLLGEQAWSGNVRELADVIERLVAFSPDGRRDQGAGRGDARGCPRGGCVFATGSDRERAAGAAAENFGRRCESGGAGVAAGAESGGGDLPCGEVRAAAAAGSPGATQRRVRELEGKSMTEVMTHIAWPTGSRASSSSGSEFILSGRWIPGARGMPSGCRP